MSKEINTKIQLRTDIEENWISANPVLNAGEIAIVKFEDGTEDIKIGNGLSTFTNLKYIYQTQIKTDQIISKDIKAKSIAQGYNVKSTPTSFATGVFTEADGNFDVVHGIEAKALSTDDYAFVFNGTNLPGINQRYESHGEGTFNINPLNGLSGFYVGEKNVATIINDNVLDAFKTISLIKPYSEQNLHIYAEFSKQKDFSSLEFFIDSSLTPKYFNGFSISSWYVCDSTGFSRDFNNHPIEIDLRQILSDNSISVNKDTKLYVRYYWYYVESQVKHRSDWYSLILPTNTEVGANSNDVVSKKDFNSIAGLVVPESKDITKSEIYDDYYTISQYNVNQLTDYIENNDKVCLYGYGQNYRYYLNFKTISSDSDISLKFYVDVGNGPEQLDTSKISCVAFKPNSNYNVEIFNDSVIVQTFDNKNFVEYGDKIILNQFKTISMIKPYCDERMFISVDVSLNKDFSNKFTVTSELSNELFDCLMITGGNSQWMTVESEGLTHASDNNPVVMNLEKALIAHNIYPTAKDLVYVKYSWYYKDSSNVIHRSDEYSIIAPTNTEVGANNSDVTSKREFNSLTAIVLPTTQDVGLDTEYETYYEVKNTIFSNITALIQTDDKILLDDYNIANSYKMKFKTANESSNLSVQFYVDYGNGPEYDDTLAINSNSFMPNTEYVIDVKNDCINVNSINKQDVVRYLKDNSNSVTLRVWDI